MFLIFHKFDIFTNLKWQKKPSSPVWFGSKSVEWTDSVDKQNTKK